MEAGSEKVEAFFVLSPLDSLQSDNSPSLRQNGEGYQKEHRLRVGLSTWISVWNYFLPRALGFSGCSPRLGTVCLSGLSISILNWFRITRHSSWWFLWCVGWTLSLRRLGWSASGDGLGLGHGLAENTVHKPERKCESRTALLAEASEPAHQEGVAQGQPASPIPASIPSRRKLCGSCRKSF